MYVTNVLLNLANFISLEDLNILIRRIDIVSKRFPFIWSLRIKCNFTFKGGVKKRISYGQADHGEGWEGSTLTVPMVPSMRAREPGLQALSNLAGFQTKHCQRHYGPRRRLL